MIFIGSAPRRTHLTYYMLREENADGTVNNRDFGTCAAAAWMQTQMRLQELRNCGFCVLPTDVIGIWNAVQVDPFWSFEAVKVMLISDLITLQQ